MFYFNHVIIPKLVRISPVYRPLENLRLEWDDTETLDIKEFIDAVVKMSPYYEFDIKELVERTGLPVTGMRGMSGESPVAPGPTPRPPVNPQKKKSEPGREKPGIADTVNALYYPDGSMPEAAGLSLEEKIRDRVLKRLAGKGFDVGKEIDPDLFAHTFGCLDKAVSKGFGKVEYGTPDYDFLEGLRHNNAVFAAFKTHRQQNEIHARLFDEDGKRKDFDRFRKDTAGILQDYNVNWLRTEYDTAVRRARFAADFRSCRANKDLYPNLEWLPSVSATPREAHRVFYGQIRPLEDPFWDTNYPGNLWNCKCGIRSTDKPVNATGDAAPVQAAPGLDKNPATSGEVFTESHPYIKGASIEAKKAVEEFVYKEYTDIPVRNGKLRIHEKHGKNERKENIKVGTYLAEKHGYEIDLIENPDGEKSADSFNRTLGCFQEYKVNGKATVNAIDMAIKSGSKQANDLVLWIDSDIRLEDLAAAIRPRVIRTGRITHITIVRNGKDKRYSREDIIAEGFKIRQADLE